MSKDKTARPTLPELERDVDETRERMSDNADTSHALAPNSYGAGYDAGYRDALVWVLENMRGELT